MRMGDPPDSTVSLFVGASERETERESLHRQTERPLLGHLTCESRGPKLGTSTSTE
jgi:hypothetical protein